MAQSGSEPKRHHWWPELQSGHWTGPDGTIHVVKADGTTFPATEKNVGVETQLYTRYDLTGAKDLTIEKWFSTEIESPFVAALGALADLKGLKRFRAGRGDPQKAAEVKALGFVVDDWREQLVLSPEHRAAITNYIAAMLVRSPRYIAKLIEFHADSVPDLEGASATKAQKTVALENMLWLYELYRDRIASAHLGLLRADCDRELLFSDGGVTAQEPWRAGPLPFDIYAPLTPKLAINILPMPGEGLAPLEVMRLNGAGVSRFNRIVVGNAQRFVYSRSVPPLKFIAEHFGKPAPKQFGSRWNNGVLETKWDRSRT